MGVHAPHSPPCNGPSLPIHVASLTSPRRPPFRMTSSVSWRSDWSDRSDPAWNHRPALLYCRLVMGKAGDLRLAACPINQTVVTLT
ncbi:hypothetical protein chiPu_0020976 [Chiloscyllium punctatum]|uniref:Uncharacterized protein n=1 Tax=Chiloscyllium punctatum TaxID=137246 RepID=A0A401RLX5_CHIPU|nr:hypothetical protein [Chiloscyllium punctatum]